MELSGNNSGISKVDFDWLEERNACIDCQPDPYPQYDDDDMYLQWSCECCGGGQALLIKQPTNPKE